MWCSNREIKKVFLKILTFYQSGIIPLSTFFFSSFWYMAKGNHWRFKHKKILPGELRSLNVRFGHQQQDQSRPSGERPSSKNIDE